MKLTPHELQEILERLHGEKHMALTQTEWCITRLLFHIIHQQEKIMASLEDIARDVTEESTLIDGVSTLITGLKTQLATALEGAGLSPDTQKQIDAIFAAAEANKAKLATALAANTPAENPPANP